MMDKVTEGKWQFYSDIHENGLHEVVIYQVPETGDDFTQGIANMETVIGNGDGIETESNAKIIVTAVNACKSINPEHPELAANEIENMHTSLKEVRMCLRMSFLKDYANEPWATRILDLLSRMER